MTDRMKNKTSDERRQQLELPAALPGGRGVTVSDLTGRVAASGWQPERICKRRGRGKGAAFPRPFPGPTAGLELGCATLGAPPKATPGAPPKATYSDSCVSSPCSFTREAPCHTIRRGTTGRHRPRGEAAGSSVVKKGNVRSGARAAVGCKPPARRRRRGGLGSRCRGSFKAAHCLFLHIKVPLSQRQGTFQCPLQSSDFLFSSA